MRVLLGFLALLLLVPAVPAGGAAWAGKKVPVYDYTSPAWEGVIAQTVAEMNAILPKKAPRLVYRRMPEVPCSQAPRRKEAIVVCLLAPGDPMPAHAAWWTDGQTILRAQIRLSPSVSPGNERRVACHEFMHVTTGIRDNYGAALSTSCVWGTLSSPGPFDVAHVKKVYRKHGDKRRN